MHHILRMFNEAELEALRDFCAVFGSGSNGRELCCEVAHAIDSKLTAVQNGDYDAPDIGDDEDDEVQWKNNWINDLVEVGNAVGEDGATLGGVATLLQALFDTPDMTVTPPPAGAGKRKVVLSNG